MRIFFALRRRCSRTRLASAAARATLAAFTAAAAAAAASSAAAVAASSLVEATAAAKRSASLFPRRLLRSLSEDRSLLDDDGIRKLDQIFQSERPLRREPPSLWMISLAPILIGTVAFADRSKLIARCGDKSAFSSPPPSASLAAVAVRVGRLLRLWRESSRAWGGGRQ